jgi:hypothetical protein
MASRSNELVAAVPPELSVWVASMVVSGFG